MIKRTLYFGNPAYLSIQNSQLIIEKSGPSFDEQNMVSIPAEDIGVVILDHQQIVISQRVLQLLLEYQCVIIVCDQKRMPQGLMLSFDGNTTQSERYRDQIEASEPLKKQLWQQTVSAKIKNQAILLQSQNIASDNMLHWADEVTSGDMKNHEARAAAYYWENIFSADFRRDRNGFPPNNLLNYGYAILRAVVARALVGSGLMLTLGIHHRNKYNAFCLADDMMEPYRPFVDKLILDIAGNTEQDVDELTPETKRKLFLIPAMDVIIGGQRSPLMIATQRTSASLVKCFSGESRKLLLPEMVI